MHEHSLMADLLKKIETVVRQKAFVFPGQIKSFTTIECSERDRGKDSKNFVREGLWLDRFRSLALPGTNLFGWFLICAAVAVLDKRKFLSTEKSLLNPQKEPAKKIKECLNHSLARLACGLRKTAGMHELSICQGIVEEAVKALARFPRIPRVSQVTVQIGRLTGIAPESLRQYFDLLIPGTPLKGATLNIEEIPIRGRCSDCGASFEIEVPSLACPQCGSGLVNFTSGRELSVVSLETTERGPWCR